MPFTKQSLSPRRIPPEVVPLPFDLTWAELDPALPVDVLSAGSSPVSTRRRELQGLRGRDRSTLLSVECGSAVVDLFVKTTDGSERHRHAVLHRADVPVPQLLAESPRERRQVVLVFECLDTIGVDIDDPIEVGELLQILAHLNAVPLDAWTPPQPAKRPETELTESVQHSLQAVNDLGLRTRLDVEACMVAYASAQRRARTMPLALTHGEFYFQQVGRRGGGPLVMFDLATVDVRPRFFDVCSILAPVAAGAGEAERTTFSRYLTLLQDRGVPVPDVAPAFVELRWLRVLRGFQSLPWLVRSYTDPDVGVGHLEAHLVTLERDLVDLDELQ